MNGTIEREELILNEKPKCEHRFTLRSPSGLEYCYICHELIGATLEALEKQVAAVTEPLFPQLYGDLAK